MEAHRTAARDATYFGGIMMVMYETRVSFIHFRFLSTRRCTCKFHADTCNVDGSTHYAFYIPQVPL